MKKSLIIIAFIISVLVLMLFSFMNNKDDSINGSINKNEYPQDEYRLDDLPVSHKSAYEVRQFFEDSDTNHDGILKDQEIAQFDYKIKHSQYGFNGPYGYN